MHAKSLRDLGLRDNSISDAGAIDIAKVLCEGSLERLDLASNGIGAGGVTALLLSLSEVRRHGLASCKQRMLKAAAQGADVEALDLSYNNVGNTAAEGLCHVMRDNPRVLRLVLKECGIEEHGILSLASVLKQSSLTHLDLEGNIGVDSPEAKKALMNAALVRGVGA